MERLLIRCHAVREASVALRNEGWKPESAEDDGDETGDGAGAVNTRGRGLHSGGKGMGPGETDSDGSDLDM